MKNIFKLVSKAASILNKKMLSWDLRQLTITFIISGLAVGLSGAYMGYTRLYLNDERVFWSAIENSMATKSVTRTIVSGGTGNQTTQSTRYSLGIQTAAESKVTFNQKGAVVDTSVATESLTFMDGQYSRYLSFSSNQKKEDGTDPSLDGLIGKWEENTVSAEASEEARLNYVGDMVSLVVFADHRTSFRQEMLRQMKDSGVYRLNIQSISQDIIDGEDVTLYPVTVSLRDYAEILQKSFAESGYGEFPPLTPSNYREGATIPATIAISTRTGNVVGVSYGQRKEVYSGYGVDNVVTRPVAEFSSGELEAAVNEELQDIQR